MSVKRSALRGVAWTSFSYATRFFFQTLVTLLLARVLLPADYGVVGIASLAIAVVALFRDLGLTSAIVRRKDIDDTMLSTAFWFNAVVGLVLASSLYLAAPAIAALLHEPRAIIVLHFFAPTFFVGSLNAVHGSLLTRSRKYRTFAIREISATILGGIVSVTMAYMGFGFYALLAQGLFSSAFSVIFLWTSVRWRPRLVVRLSALKELLAYGLPLAGSNALNFFSRNLDNLLVGRFLGVAALGLYGFAYNVIASPIAMIQTILGRVMFPEMARIQDDLPHVRSVYVSSIRHIATASWLPLGGLLVLAPVFVPWAFGAHWVPAIYLVQTFCFVAIGQAIGTTIGWIYQSQGRTKQYFWSNLAFSACVYVAFIVGLQWGLTGVATGYLLVSYTLGVPYNALAFRIIGLRNLDILKALRWLTLALAYSMAGMFIVLMAVRNLHPMTVPETVLVVGGTGTLLYATLLWITERHLLVSVWHLPRDLLRARGPGPAQSADVLEGPVQ